MPAYWPNGLPGPDIENGDNPVVISTPATGYVDDVNSVFQSNHQGETGCSLGEGPQRDVQPCLWMNPIRPIKRFRTPWYPLHVGLH